MRLNKFLRDAGIAARRKADEVIREGRVRVAGQVVREPWHEVLPGRDEVHVDGQPVRLPAARRYVKLHKPRGVTSTLADPHAERTLARYIPTGTRMVPVGRLDKDSEGLILLTDDGELAYRLTHPRFEVPKRYRATLNRPFGREHLDRFKAGFPLADGPFSPTGVQRVGDRSLELTLHEGRKREIRRAFAVLGLEVVRLVRLSIGPVGLGDLQPGEMSELSASERRALGVDRALGADPGVTHKLRRYL